MTQILTIIAAILIFAVLIFVHEAGHFIAAKLSGVKVLEFALGMGPKIFSKKKGDTLYSIRALPIGGFCSMEGEDGGSEDEGAFSKKPAWKRLAVLVAGALMNILLGFFLVFIMLSFTEAHTTNTVATVLPGGYAEECGMLPGDTILEIDGKRVSTGLDVQYKAMREDDSSTIFTVKRKDKVVDLTIKKESGKPYGITLATEKATFLNNIKHSYHRTGFYSKLILQSFVDLLRGRVPVSDLSGPIGIVSEIGSAVEEGIKTGEAGIIRLLSLAVLLTVNLGIFNLLPIPALDGGRILFVLIEMITRRRMPPEKEGIVHLVGFALLMLFAVFVAYMDILKIFN